MKRFLSLILVSISIGQSLRASDVGHGGDGVLIGSKPYLLDLVENGSYKDPYFGPTFETRFKDISEEVLGLSGTPPEVVDYVAKKFTDIYKLDKLLALSLLSTMRMYNWLYVDQKLVEIADEDSILDFKGLPLIQLAIRRNRSISINAQRAEELDSKNHAALILHEIVYALIRPTRYKVYERDAYKQESSRAREITGYLFTKGLVSKGKEVLVRLVGSALPMRKERNYSLVYEFENPSRPAIWIDSPKLKVRVSGQSKTFDLSSSEDAKAAVDYVCTFGSDPNQGRLFVLNTSEEVISFYHSETEAMVVAPPDNTAPAVSIPRRTYLGFGGWVPSIFEEVIKYTSSSRECIDFGFAAVQNKSQEMIENRYKNRE